VIFNSNVLDFIIILAIAFALSLLFTKLKLPSLTAFIIAGILASSNTFSHLNFRLISDTHLTLLYSIFSLLLFLCIGIKFPIARIWRYANIAFIATLIEVFFSVSAIYLVSLYLLKFSLIEAALMGAALTPSSSFLILRLIHEEKMIKESFASILVAISLIENVMFVILLTILGILVSIKIDYISLSTQLSLVTLFTGLLLIGGSYAFPRIFEKIAGENDYYSLILMLSLVFAIAYLGNFLLIAPLTSIFLTSITLSSIKLRSKIEENFKYFEEIVAGIFFFYLGYLFNIWKFLNFDAIIVLYFSLFASKFLPVYFLFRIAGYGKEIARKTGITLTSPGELSFIIAYFVVFNYGLNSNILQYTLAIILINFFIYPFIIKRIK